jgi:hypothetical protein
MRRGCFVFLKSLLCWVEGGGRGKGKGKGHGMAWHGAPELVDTPKDKATMPFQKCCMVIWLRHNETVLGISFMKTS